jgi:hypothetical protein
MGVNVPLAPRIRVGRAAALDTHALPPSPRGCVPGKTTGKETLWLPNLSLSDSSPRDDNRAENPAQQGHEAHASESYGSEFEAALMTPRFRKRMALILPTIGQPPSHSPEGFIGRLLCSAKKVSFIGVKN